LIIAETWFTQFAHQKFTQITWFTKIYVNPVQTNDKLEQ